MPLRTSAVRRSMQEERRVHPIGLCGVSCGGRVKSATNFKLLLHQAVFDSKRHSNKVANSEFETIFPRSQPHHHLLILLNTHIICHSKTSAGRGARLVLPSDVHIRNSNNPTEHFHQQRRGAEEWEHKAVQLAAVHHHQWEGMSRLAIL